MEWVHEVAQNFMVHKEKDEFKIKKVQKKVCHIFEIILKNNTIHKNNTI